MCLNKSLTVTRKARLEMPTLEIVGGCIILGALIILGVSILVYHFFLKPVEVELNPTTVDFFRGEGVDETMLFDGRWVNNIAKVTQHRWIHGEVPEHWAQVPLPLYTQHYEEEAGSGENCRTSADYHFALSKAVRLRIRYEHQAPALAKRTSVRKYLNFDLTLDRLESTNSDWHRVFFLHHFLGLTPKQMADMLGMTQEACSQLYTEAKRYLIAQKKQSDVRSLPLGDG